MKRRRSIAVLATLPFAAGAAAVAQELNPLKVVVIPGDSAKGVYYGVRAGLYKKYNLDVQIIQVPTGSVVAQALIGGTADIGFTSTVTLIAAHRKGVPLQIVTPASWVTTRLPYVGIYVLKDSPLRTGRDLNGKTVGTPGLGDLLAVGTMAWVDQNGGDSKTVKDIEIGASSAVPLLEAGRADAVALNAPFAMQALNDGKIRLLGRPMEAIAKEFQGGAYVAMEAVIAKSPSTFSRFAHAFQEATNWTNNHLPETVEMVAGYTGQTVETISKMVRQLEPEYVDVRNLQPVIDAMAKYGALDKAFPAQELISSVALTPPRRR